MTVYDRAHELARALKQSEVYSNYLGAKETLERNSGALEMFRDFRRRQFELQRVQLLGQKLTEEQIQNIERLSELMTQHSIIKEYLEAELRFGQMFADIQKIIADSIDFNFNPFMSDEEAEDKI